MKPALAFLRQKLTLFTVDTLSNVVASTAKLILGDKTPTTQEPVSGRRGDPSKGEPYDAGNMEPISEDAGKEAVPDEAMTRRVDDGASPKTNDGADNSSNEPSMTKEPGISPEGQTDTRPVPQDNKLEPKSAATDIHETPEGAPDETQNFDGPGPRPIEEVAKESGGDASNNNQTVTSGAKTSIKEADDKEEGEGEGEGGEGDSSGSTRSGQTEQHKNKGTGELYVRSSGMHADGGDFDATKPGAGREADRLMEEKGMRDASDSGSNHDDDDDNDDDDNNDDDGTSKKRSIGRKIKDKLHRH